MRKDMAKVVVTRPRILDSVVRNGRAIPDEIQPKTIGLRRHAQERGGYKMLNENLAPLRRYLEAQVGRPWNVVYSEISANLKPSSTVQQHMRDHLDDFVNLHPRPRLRRRWIDAEQRWVAEPAPWFEPLFVDRRGILRRTAELSWVRRYERMRQGRPPPAPKDLVRLSALRELRKIDGVWFEVTMAPLPQPEYRRVRRQVKQPVNPYDPAAPERTVEIWAHQLITPGVRDAVTGATVLAGPEVDDHARRRSYEAEHPERVYAVGKRQLSRRELRRHGLTNEPEAPAIQQGLLSDLPLRWPSPPRYARP
jgi:hypothetical protein